MNDNTYGTNSDIGWKLIGKTHTFGNLTGSDKAGFLVKYSDGTTLVQFYQDYITLGGANTEGYTAWSGYQSLGFSGGDGDPVAGNTAVLKDFDSTLELNLNQPGTANNGVAYTANIVNSPTNGVNNPLPTDPKWDAVNGYYFTRQIGVRRRQELRRRRDLRPAQVAGEDGRQQHLRAPPTSATPGASSRGTSTSTTR